MGSESKVDLIASQHKDLESCHFHGLGGSGIKLLPGGPAAYRWHVAGSQKEPGSEEVSLSVASKGMFATNVSPWHSRLQEAQRYESTRAELPGHL